MSASEGPKVPKDVGPAGSSGFGGLLPAVSKWLPWVGLVVVAGIAGGAVGASGVLTPTQPAAPVPSIGTLGNAVTATGCPGGSGVVELIRGTRVLAVTRTDDSAYLGVRDPLDLGRTVWLPTGVVLVDEGQPAVSTLPVGGCPVPTLLAEEPVPVPDPTQAPAPAPAPPPPPSDTTPPGLGQASGTPNPFYNDAPITITAFASDNVGVSTVLISWSGAVSGSSSMNNVGGNQWQFVFSTSAQSFGPVTFTMVAVDGSGNQSPQVSVVTSHNYFG